MARFDAPGELRALADERAAARRARDWATADALKARIEGAGWRVIDTGTLYDLVRAAPPDVDHDGVTWYGSSGSVPFRLDEAETGVATVVTVVNDGPQEVAPLLRSLAGHAPDGTRVVVVANGLDLSAARALAALETADPGAPGIDVEVVRLAGRLGMAAACNAGIRRSAGPIVILADPTLEPSGDLVGGIAAALADPGVAVAGPFGLVTDDLRHFEPAPDGAHLVEAVALAAMGFRRADVIDRGPLDEHFSDPAYLDAWWSFVLRDPPADAPAEAAPRRAVQVGGLRVRRAEPRGDEVAGGDRPGRAHAARRNRYRMLKRFATRRDLLVDDPAER